jgi:hypothetical protein
VKACVLLAMYTEDTGPAQSVCARQHMRFRAGRLRSLSMSLVLSTIVIVLLVLWLLGVVTSYTMGGLIHILLVVAVIAVLLRIIQGRNPLAS